jgi:hypothetical protein
LPKDKFRYIDNALSKFGCQIFGPEVRHDKSERLFPGLAVLVQPSLAQEARADEVKEAS